jgi:electron transfer flavoprotein alpha subunit
VSALAPAIAAAKPDFVVLPHTYQSCDYMARLAQRLGAGLLPEVISFAAGESGLSFKRPILQGKMQAVVRARGDSDLGSFVVSVQSGCFAADGFTPGEAPVRELELATVVADREVLGTEAAAANTVDLASADRIVSVGRGIGGPDKMKVAEDLAAALGAEIGASRPVIDNGWLARDRQIGSSGQTVAPKLYMALGISGAIQHLVGMKGSSCIVAVNKDAGAPIFNVAHYGVVADLHEFVPAFLKALNEA